MARARNIKPGFYKNEDLAECSVWARFIFPGLWMLADREGRLEDRPKRIKGELIPFDTVDVEPLLRELEARSFILRYQIEGASYIQISKFKTHQTPHYSEKQSVIKPPALQENPQHIEPVNSENPPPIKRGSQPPDSLNPDSPNPESGKERTPSAKRAPRRVAKTALPPDFCLSDRLKAWAEEHEFSNLETHLEHFVGKARANGYAYADWDQALMNAIRENWAGVGIKSNGGRNGAENLWRMSDAGIEAKGRELGMMARGGESYRDYAARIAQHMEAGQ